MRTHTSQLTLKAQQVEVTCVRVDGERITRTVLKALKPGDAVSIRQEPTDEGVLCGAYVNDDLRPCLSHTEPS